MKKKSNSGVFPYKQMCTGFYPTSALYFSTTVLGRKEASMRGGSMVKVDMFIAK